MTSIGVPRLVVAKILNHVEQGVTQVYDRHSYDLEKRQALGAWAEKLLAVVSSELGHAARTTADTSGYGGIESEPKNFATEGRPTS
jgi:hypothetical protein